MAAIAALTKLAIVTALLLYCDAVGPLVLAPQLGSFFASEAGLVWRLAAALGAELCNPLPATFPFSQGTTSAITDEEPRPQRHHHAHERQVMR